MDDPKNDQEQQREELRDLTQTVRDIDIHDPQNARNETHMKDAQGREIEFNE